MHLDQLVPPQHPPVGRVRVFQHLVQVVPRLRREDVARAVGDPGVGQPPGAAQLEHLPADQLVTGIGLVDRAGADDPVVGAAQRRRVLLGERGHDGLVHTVKLRIGPANTLYRASRVKPITGGSRCGGGSCGTVSNGTTGRDAVVLGSRLRAAFVVHTEAPPRSRTAIRSRWAGVSAGAWATTAATCSASLPPAALQE